MSTIAACKTNNCCERKRNITFYVSNKDLSELPQSDDWFPVSNPDHMTIGNVVELSVAEVKNKEKERILKRKAPKAKDVGIASNGNSKVEEQKEQEL